MFYCSTGLPLARTRSVWSTFSSHFSLSSKQRRWLTSATLTTVSSENVSQKVWSLLFLTFNLTQARNSLLSSLFAPSKKAFASSSFDRNRWASFDFKLIKPHSIFVPSYSDPKENEKSRGSGTEWRDNIWPERCRSLRHFDYCSRCYKSYYGRSLRP